MVFAERANRLLGERITAMLSEAGLSKAFWAECLAALVHVLDRCPTSAVQGATPYELWNKKKPNVGHLRVWGCVAYVHIQRDKRSKLERASRDDRARDPRMWKQLRIEARKRTRCVTSEFQLGFSQLEPWYIYSSLTNDYHDHVTRSME